MDTKLIPNHNKRAGYSEHRLYYCGRFPGGSTAIFSPKIAPKHNTKTCYPSVPAVAAEMGGFLDKGGTMPRMPKKRKLELSFFLNERGRVAYNTLCRKCRRACKQSFRAVIIDCPKYLSKRAKRREETD